MSGRWLHALALIAGCAINGCAAGCAGKVPETRYYHLAPTAAGRSGGDAVLVIEPLATDAAYDDERIVYRLNPYRFDYYDYHRWSAAPGVMIANYLEQALEHSGRFRSVVREVTPGSSAVLSGRVAAIEEVDVSREQWRGRVVIELRLTDAISGDTLWSEQFEETEPLAAQSPEGLARGLSVAMGRIAAKAGPAIADALATQAATAAATAAAGEAASAARGR